MAKRHTHNPRSGKSKNVFYSGAVAIGVAAVGVLFGGAAIALPGDANLAATMGMTNADATQAMGPMGVMMVIESLFLLVAGIFGVRAANSGYPLDGRPFFVMSVLTLAVTAAGIAFGATSFVAILVAGVCAYFAWGFMKQPMKKSKSKKSKANKGR